MWNVASFPSRNHQALPMRIPTLLLHFHVRPGADSVSQPRATRRFAFDRSASTFAGTTSRPLIVPVRGKQMMEVLRAVRSMRRGAVHWLNAAALAT